MASSTAASRSPPPTWACARADACANVWAYLTNRLNETVVQFYTPTPRPTGELNPRLGCWGPRPDLIEDGLVESDCAIAVILGLSIWLPGAHPVDDQVFLEALRDTLVEALSYWVVVAQRVGRPRDRTELSGLSQRRRPSPVMSAPTTSVWISCVPSYV